MISLFPVPARRLHGRPVRLRDATVAEASVFPYFDSEGVVTSLMLVWPASPSILMLGIEPGRVRVPWLGPVGIDADFAELRDADAARARDLAGGLWHWDPWWVLEAARYHGHPAVPVLKATNCVDLFPQPHGECFFARDLTRVAGFARRSESGVTIDHELMSVLPARSPTDPETATGAPTGWRLDPFWRRQPRGRDFHCR